MQAEISKATERNWKRLGTNADGRLASRANKKRSEKRIVPMEYFTDRSNYPTVKTICDFILEHNFPVSDALFTIGLSLLERKNLTMQDEHVNKSLSEFGCKRIDALCKLAFPDNELDLLGLVYQMLKTEGDKNRQGAYYTPRSIVNGMLPKLKENEKLLDCCCGSGAYLIAANACPEQLYGIDSDKIAVMLTRINLLLKYNDFDFIPQVICADFLVDNNAFKCGFDNIVTNLPWGADIGAESFGKFIEASFEKLNKGGTMRFLLPKSFLNVRAHCKTRQFVLSNTRIDSITLYDDDFSGVTTKFIDVQMSKNEPCDSVSVTSTKGSFFTEISDFQNSSFAFRLYSKLDRSILQKVNAKKVYTLKDSEFALGIVTGNNKKLLKNTQEIGTEPIFTGKEVEPFSLAKPRCFIKFSPESFQQCANERFYRSEKLVYKFIGSRLVFAYDDSGALTLNSANVLIPHINGYSIKTVMMFLNSALFTYLHRFCNEIKILKSDLLELPFPAITNAQNEQFEGLFAKTSDTETIDKLNDLVFDIFDLDAEDRKYIFNKLKENK